MKRSEPRSPLLGLGIPESRGDRARPRTGLPAACFLRIQRGEASRENFGTKLVEPTEAVDPSSGWAWPWGSGAKPVGGMGTRSLLAPGWENSLDDLPNPLCLESSILCLRSFS